MLCLPILHKPSLNPTEVVVFPSPAGVGVIAVTRINFESSFFSLILLKSIFAVW